MLLDEAREMRCHVKEFVTYAGSQNEKVNGVGLLLQNISVSLT